MCDEGHLRANVAEQDTVGCCAVLTSFIHNARCNGVDILQSAHDLVRDHIPIMPDTELRLREHSCERHSYFVRSTKPCCGILASPQFDCNVRASEIEEALQRNARTTVNQSGGGQNMWRWLAAKFHALCKRYDSRRRFLTASNGSCKWRPHLCGVGTWHAVDNNISVHDSLLKVFANVHREQSGAFQRVAKPVAECLVCRQRSVLGSAE
mmetsp:Transcript_69559/g.137653  ORF Transcript_69559/g.137653 Transcript_69559/m.137653 type:complete len:209 (-) Transcript_69559:375-1001(-)